MELNRLLSEKTYERDDAYFVSKFKTLRYKITDWAKRLFSDDKSQLAFSLPRSWTSHFRNKHSYKDMANLACDNILAENFVDSAQARFLMVEAFVWRYIVTNVVGNNGHIWAGSLKGPMGAIKTVLHPGKVAHLGGQSLTVWQPNPVPARTMIYDCIINGGRPPQA